MRNQLFIGSVIVVLAAPALAQAQGPAYDPHCRRENQKGEQTSTIVGALGGAVVGGAVAGKRNRTLGAVVGGLGGAFVGNQVAKSGERPCPPGYVNDAPPPPAYAPPRESEFWRGAPDELGRRLDFLQDRIDRAREFRRIDRREARELSGEVAGLRREERQMRYRDHGRLSPPDRDALFERMDEISRRLHWESDRGERYDRDERH